MPGMNHHRSGIPGAGPAPRIGLDVLQSKFDCAEIMRCVRQALIDHSLGRFVQATPVHLMFSGGDCHVKSGHLLEGEFFTIKIASGFHGNVRYGLPNATGMTMLLSQATGRPCVIYEDEGYLTAWRTVAATMHAAVAGTGSGRLRVGIIGAGLQAELTAHWLDMVFPDRVAAITIWSRKQANARALASRLGNGARAAGLRTLCADSNLIITATPSDTPLVLSEWVRDGTHIVAIGADNPGKIELDPALFKRCDTVYVDDLAQCLDHGELGAAAKLGFASADSAVSLGSVLASGRYQWPRTVSIADLTGLAAQDDAVARLFLSLCQVQQLHHKPG